MSHENYGSVIQTLHECMTACNHCYDSCLREDDVKMMAECIRMDRECSDICGYLEQALVRGTPFVAELATACATICEACGNECKKHDHKHCQDCAEACFKCAEECKKLAS
ncbi:four-helix bundle copper-binding protein [Guptibacillus hwajinpoensis]|uniref:four-helix bundle copper-binding protein n=1 Tax=Guptibacillus hwajinpoensis TaxID=208199 RepID=UPI00384BB884